MVHRLQHLVSVSTCMSGFARRIPLDPIRYTSLGLALCEAMMAGMSVVPLATTEAVTVVDDGASGFIANDVDRRIDGMVRLLDELETARRMGKKPGPRPSGASRSIDLPTNGQS